ncbi:MAG: YfhO family protein, partial [Armatimonadetes bacterium]|nr:YfhO family protein [Armatimonadota bacterium]
WLAFGIPAALLLLGFFTRGVFPIANRNVLTIDLFHQYAPFLAELQHKLKAGESLLYSWSGGLGVNFYALFAYYLASPLNLLILLFPPAYLTEAVLLLVVVKIGLAGACFYRFLAGVHRKDSLLMVVLSSFYALSAFSMAYYWNIMWLDTLFLLPLLLLGLVRMVRDGRWLLYTLSLALLIYSNYYMAFFACLFTGLYFLVCLFQYQTLARPGPFFAAIGRTVLFTALGAGLSAVLSLPTFFSLQATSAAGDAFPVDWQHLYDLLDYMGQHYLLQPPAIRSGMPNLYAGILLLFLLPLYVLSRRLSVKEKLLNLSLFVFLVISFNVNVFNFIWHGLHFPNQLPYRNAFVYVFLVLTMAYPALEEVPSFSGRQIGGLALAAAGSVLLAQKVLASPPSWLTVLVTLLFIVLYAVLLTLPHSRSISRFDWSRALLILVVVELAVHVFVSLHMIDLAESLSNRDGYLDGRQVAEIRQELKRIDREEGDGFYRLEVQPPRTTNDPFLYSYRGISIFASTMQTKPVTFFENLGYHSNGINSYKYEGSTLVLDSLFGLKYLIRRSGEQVYDLLQLQAQTDQITTYRNPYALSFGLLGSEALLDWQSGPGSPFDAQNRLFEALSGEKDVFRPLTTDEGELNNLSFTSKGSHQFA